MRKIGFTIAESLITLAIIGIVATLILPVFTSKYRKQVYSASLSSAVSNFDNAMSLLMTNECVDSLLNTKAWNSIYSDGEYSLDATSDAVKIKAFMSEISKTLPINGYTTDTAYYKTLAAPTSSITVSFGAPVRFKAKSGVEYMIYIVDVKKSNEKSESDIVAQGGNYTNQAAEVYIDINGEASPNVIGRDYFRFELGTDGHLYPYGGLDWYVYNNKTYESPKTKCVNDKNGYYCAAYLAEDGYKMDY